MTIREIKENNEEIILRPRASKSAASKGRVRPEKTDDIRTCFEIDRARIIYSKAFRRLKHKTQVFISPESDHTHTRLTHTLEVADIADRIAGGLGLNRELTNAIALGHDLGHAPFGHAGEAVLNELYPGFAHNEQSLRVVDILEDLNLSFEVRDGILNHRTANTPATLEGKIVNISDKIAYINHDLEDALASGMISRSDFPSRIFEVLGESGEERINTMVNDVIFNSIDKAEIRKSPLIGALTDELRSLLFEKLYLGSAPKANQEEKAGKCLKMLFYHYMENPGAMPEEYAARGREDLARSVCDYISGMTDNFAIETYKEIFLPLSHR